MTEQEFLKLHPDVLLKVGRSSEDGTWWADARTEAGAFIAAYSGKATLDEALRDVHFACKRHRCLVINTEGLKKDPMRPDRLRRMDNYGLSTDLEPNERDK